MPTLKQLKYLCAVAEQRHFGKAAKACFVSQSTLSWGIAELEDKLKVTLIERNNKGVRLTAIGKEIHSRAQHLLTASEDLVAVATAAKKPFSTELRMGVIPTIAPFVLPSMLSYIRKLHPNFKIYVKEALSRHLVDDLQDGNLDILLLALPFPVENVEHKHLFYDDFILAYPNDHHFTRKKDIALSDLKDEDLLLLEDGHCIRDHALDACRMKVEELQVPYQATSLNTIIQMVANKMGVTILPQMAVEANILRGTDVITQSFSETNVWRSIGLMWRCKTPREKEFQALGELIIESQQSTNQDHK